MPWRSPPAQPRFREVVALSNTRVVFLQPYVPSYRVPLFDELSAQLSTEGLELVVAHGRPLGAQSRRSDVGIARDWMSEIQVTHGMVAGADIRYKHASALMRSAQVLVSELASGDLTTWVQLMRRPSRVVLWGHGKSYVAAIRPLDAWIEVQQARRAAHTMTYVESGKAELVRRGVDAGRVTAVGNSTDTVTLRALADGARSRRDDIMGRLGVGAHAALYAGGLDADKRIEFLLSAAERAAELDADFTLIVAGDGEEAGKLRVLEGKPWLRWVGTADAAKLAELAIAVECVWMPGRVGLVAVDSLALQLPLLTTRFKFHAPEIELLAPDTDLFYLPDSPRGFAEAAVELTARWRAEGKPESTTPVPTVSDVAAKMVRVLTLVASR